MWGSGHLKPSDMEAVKRVDGDLDVRAVRGPRTRNALLKLGVACPEIYGDPAILLPFLIAKSPSIPDKVGVVPHYSQFKEMSSAAESDPRVRVIDVRRPWQEVVKEISSCEAVISSSLHGLIVGETYGIPSVLVIFGKVLHGDLLKFHDYFESTGRDCSYSNCLPDSPLPIDALLSAAHKCPKPSFDREGILQSFPYLREGVKNLEDLAKYSSLYCSKAT